MLPDQPKVVVATANVAKPTPKHAAYIHEACAFDEVEELMLDSWAEVSRFDLVATLEPIAERARGESFPVPDRWKYRPLMDWFATQDAPRLTLTFDEIEQIVGGPLPVHARRDRSWWRYKPGPTKPPRAWGEHGYECVSVDFKKLKAKFSRPADAGQVLVLPKQLTGRVPDNLAFEFETLCADLIKRYGL